MGNGSGVGGNGGSVCSGVGGGEMPGGPDGVSYQAEFMPGTPVAGHFAVLHLYHSRTLHFASLLVYFFAPLPLCSVVSSGAKFRDKVALSKYEE